MAARRWIASSLVLTLVAAAPDAGAKTFVMPHMLEASGKISNTQYTFDTSVFMTYTPGLAGLPPGGGATVDLYLYAANGSPLQASGGAVVCNPCSYSLSDVTRKRSVTFDDLIMAAGGFMGGVESGFAVIDVGGDDPDNVSIQAMTLHSRTSPFDIDLFDFPAWPCEPRRTWVIPHILERAASAGQTFTFDTDMWIVYTGGLAGQPDPGDARLQLHLFDNNGQPMRALGGAEVCNPCTFAIGSSARKLHIGIDALIELAGGFDAQVKTGFAVLLASGAGAGQLTLTGAMTNTRSNVHDLSVFGFDPQPILAESQLAVEGRDAPGAAGALRVSPNPATDGLAFAFDLSADDHVTLAIHDVSGREVARLADGRFGPGPHTLRWDGRGADGTRLQAGVYYARLAGADGARASRLVLLD